MVEASDWHFDPPLRRQAGARQNTQGRRYQRRRRKTGIEAIRQPAQSDRAGHPIRRRWVARSAPGASLSRSTFDGASSSRQPALYDWPCRLSWARQLNRPFRTFATSSRNFAAILIGTGATGSISRSAFRRAELPLPRRSDAQRDIS